MVDPLRRALFGGAAGAALTGGAGVFGAAPASAAEGTEDFGLVGDGVADDSAALQRAVEAAFAGGDAKLVTLPPGRYRVTRPIRLRTAESHQGNITQPAGLRGFGATILSEVGDGAPVFEIESRATLRFCRIEGLHILGGGQEGPGLRISCQKRGAYFYNFCLRDCVVESCGGNGCELIGNVFEGQVFNCYFRDNGRDGARFAHGAEDTVFSAVHVFGCVFGGNGRNGVSLEDGAADVSFHGCYFLLNGAFGLSADTGVTLLSHCGFENNHERAESFEDGDAGLRLLVGGTLIGCTAYSIYRQKRLLRAYVSNRLVMVGCRGSGGGAARRAGLASLDGRKEAAFTLVGCQGAVKKKRGIEALNLGGGEGLAFGAEWNSRNLLTLGEHRLWVDGDGALRVAKGRPQSDKDGKVVGG